ncbi:hypothetical protein C7B61_00135 [filamentous cyanobacterium CCP1]|nr:hypothetical protein C7B61_00135 [filamentous cyanobacterium CCP1]
MVLPVHPKLLSAILLSFVFLLSGCKTTQTSSEVNTPEPEVILDPDPKAYAQIASGSCSGCNLQGVRLAPLELINAELKNINFERAVLRGVNFSGSNLEGANFRYADIREMFKRPVVKRPASFEGANLTGSDFSGSNLHASSLKNSNLKAAKLIDTNLTEADLSGAILENTDLTGAIFNQKTKSDVDLRELGAHFIGPEGNLSGVNISQHYYRLQSQDFKEADLSNANLSNMIIAECSFSNSNLENASLEGTVLGGTGFTNDFTNSNLTKANLVNSDLRSVDLSSANLAEANLSGAIYDENTVFPENFDHGKNGTILFKHGSNLEGRNLSKRVLILDEHNEDDVEKLILINSDLQGSLLNGNFQGTDFNGANLRGAILRGNFRGANFDGADLSNALIVDSDFRDANLENAIFTDALIFYNTLTVNRTMENFGFPEGFYPLERGARIVDTAQEFSYEERTEANSLANISVNMLPEFIWKLIHVNTYAIEESTFLPESDRYQLINSRFLNFAGLKVTGKEKNPVYLFTSYGTALLKAEITNVDWMGNDFQKTSFQEAQLKNVDLSYATLSESNFYLAKMRNVNLYGANFLPQIPNNDGSAYLSNIESACMVTMPDGKMITDGC